MPRHVSIAKSYDWTDELYECVSVSKSKIHENMYNVPQRFTEKSKSQRIRWCSNGVRLTPGRMFSKDRGVLTKGEVNIIHGIYENRGDIALNDTDANPRSHKDAWLVGKHSRNCNVNQTEYSDIAYQRDTTVPDQKRSSLFLDEDGGRMVSSTKKNCNSVTGPTTVNIRFSNGITYSSRTPGKAANLATTHVCSAHSQFKTNDSISSAERKQDKIHCMSDRAEHHERHSGGITIEHQLIQDGEMYTSATNHETMFSPSERTTMDVSDSMLHKNQELCDYKGRSEQINNGKQNSKNWDVKKPREKKLQMDVYLPSIPLDPTNDDIKLSLQEGRPLLNRERPMSHSRYNHKLDQQTQ